MNSKANEVLQDALPPFLPPDENKGSPAKAPRFVQVDPNQLKFQLGESGPCKRTLQLTNVSGVRIAWRVRTNAPTRYIISPACGFLTSNEAQTISIDLMDSNKYNDRHRFMVQSMEAKDDEKDRRKIWDDNRANQLDIVQCVRVFTTGIGPVMSQQSILSILGKSLCTGGAGSPAASASASATSVTSSTSGTSTASNGSTESSGSVTTTTSTATSTPSNASTETSTGSSSTTATSATSGNNNPELSARIAELTALAKESLAAKEKVSQQMVQAVNDVKRIEVELDRAALQSNELDTRHKGLLSQIESMEKRSKQLDADIKALLYP